MKVVVVASRPSKANSRESRTDGASEWNRTTKRGVLSRAGWGWFVAFHCPYISRQKPMVSIESVIVWATCGRKICANCVQANWRVQKMCKPECLAGIRANFVQGLLPGLGQGGAGIPPWNESNAPQTTRRGMAGHCGGCCQGERPTIKMAAIEPSARQRRVDRRKPSRKHGHAAVIATHPLSHNLSRLLPSFPERFSKKNFQPVKRLVDTDVRKAAWNKLSGGFQNELCRLGQSCLLAIQGETISPLQWAFEMPKCLEFAAPDKLSPHFSNM